MRQVNDAAATPRVVGPARVRCQRLGPGANAIGRDVLPEWKRADRVGLNQKSSAIFAVGPARQMDGWPRLVARNDPRLGVGSVGWTARQVGDAPYSQDGQLLVATSPPLAARKRPNNRPLWSFSIRNCQFSARLPSRSKTPASSAEILAFPGPERLRGVVDDKEIVPQREAIKHAFTR